MTALFGVWVVCSLYQTCCKWLKIDYCVQHLTKTSAIIIYYQPDGELALYKCHLSHSPDLRSVFTRKKYLPRSIHIPQPQRGYSISGQVGFPSSSVWLYTIFSQRCILFIRTLSFILGTLFQLIGPIGVSLCSLVHFCYFYVKL